MNVLQYLSSINGNLLLFWRISSGKTNEIVSLNLQFSVSKLLIVLIQPQELTPLFLSLSNVDVA